MKYDKTVTINLGNYESMKIGVSEAPSYDDCDKMIIQELERKGIPVGQKIRQMLGWK